jgi:hypothetical protein
MGVVSAALRFGGIDWMLDSWAEGTGAEILSLLMYALLIGYFVYSVLKKKN